MLKSEEFGIIISAREYYNSVRKIITNKEQPRIIDRLLIVFQEEGFIYRIRIKIKENNASEPTKRQIIQL